MFFISPTVKNEQNAQYQSPTNKFPWPILHIYSSEPTRLTRSNAAKGESKHIERFFLMEYFERFYEIGKKPCPNSQLPNRFTQYEFGTALLFYPTYVWRLGKRTLSLQLPTIGSSKGFNPSIIH